MTTIPNRFSEILGDFLGRAIGRIVDEERPREPDLEADEPDDGAEVDRIVTGVRVENLQPLAASARYPASSKRWGGKVKRTLDPPRDLLRYSVGIALHSMGVMRPESSKRWHLITSHWAASHERALWLHPHETQLIAANMLDVRPLHAVSVESIGKGGDHPVSDAVIQTTRECVRQIIAAQAAKGQPVRWIAPHRVGAKVGDRPACPGSAIWAEVGEWAARTYGLAVPPETPLWRGCAVIPAQWHGRYWDGGEGLRRMTARGV